MSGDVLIRATTAEVGFIPGAFRIQLENLISPGCQPAQDPGEGFFLPGRLGGVDLCPRGLRLKISQSTIDGQQVLLRLVTPCALFGGIAFSQQETYPANALADEDSLALCWSKAQADGIRRQRASTGFECHSHDGRSRPGVSRTLQPACHAAGGKAPGSIDPAPASQAGRKIEEPESPSTFPYLGRTWAEMNGTTLYTVSRIMSQWEQQGLVLLGRERVVIRYPHGLVRIAEDLV